jgi:putative chitinase
MPIDRAKFFTDVRPSVFLGHLNQKEVDGLNFILDEWEATPAFTDTRWLAYMLGTAYHETAATMQPVHEFGGNTYFIRMYDIEGSRPKVAASMGNTEPGDGIKYCGRGYVQLTWKNNYARMGRLLGIDLVNDPDLAMDPKTAVKIMFRGMTDPDPRNTFSGVNLQHFFNDANEDWIGARHIINGTDHAEMIAETAQNFNDALP